MPRKSRKIYANTLDENLKTTLRKKKNNVGTCQGYYLKKISIYICEESTGFSMLLFLVNQSFQQSTFLMAIVMSVVERRKISPLGYACHHKVVLTQKGRR